MACQVEGTQKLGEPQRPLAKNKLPPSTTLEEFYRRFFMFQQGRYQHFNHIRYNIYY